MKDLGYRFIVWFMQAVVRLTTRLQVSGREHLPLSGSFAIVSNHLGRLDPPLVYYFLDRRDIILMVAEKYKMVPFIGWGVRQVDGLFVDRFGADFATVREALHRLKAGGVLVLAPEGTRSKTGALLPGQPGAAYLAIKANVPIIPVAITGTEDRTVLANLMRLRRSLVHLRVGAPFTLPPLRGDRDLALASATDEIMCRLAALLPASYRGVYAEHPRLLELLEN